MADNHSAGKLSGDELLIKAQKHSESVLKWLHTSCLLFTKKNPTVSLWNKKTPRVSLWSCVDTPMILTIVGGTCLLVDVCATAALTM